jgi:hypothetical protein
VAGLNPANRLSGAQYASFDQRRIAMQHGKVTSGNDNLPMLHLMSMPARARAIAAHCGSQEVAELLEQHARLCERNLAAATGKKRRKGRRPAVAWLTGADRI